MPAVLFFLIRVRHPGRTTTGLVSADDVVVIGVKEVYVDLFSVEAPYGPTYDGSEVGGTGMTWMKTKQKREAKAQVRLSRAEPANG